MTSFYDANFTYNEVWHWDPGDNVLKEQNLEQVKQFQEINSQERSCEEGNDIKVVLQKNFKQGMTVNCLFILNCNTCK